MSNVFFKHANNEDSDSFHSFNESLYSDEYSVSLKSNEAAVNKKFNTALIIAESTNDPVDEITTSTKPGTVLGACNSAVQTQTSDYVQQLIEYEAPTKADEIVDQQPDTCSITSQSPKVEEFNMDARKQHSRNSALQKYAFTKIWVGSQQPLAGKRSLTREFSTALDAYLNQTNKPNLLSKPTKEEKAKGETNKQLFVNEPEFVNLPLTTEKPYVSPFEDMPTDVPQSAQFLDEKKTTIVPAGFDLMSLAKYNDPNHWHRLPTTRNTDTIQ